MKQIKVIGIGMGDEASMTAAARDWIRECDLLIGASRMAKAASAFDLAESRDGKFSASPEKEVVIAWKPEDICNAIRQSQAEKIAVLMSGDIGFYSGARALRKEMEAACWGEVSGLASDKTAKETFAASETERETSAMNETAKERHVANKTEKKRYVANETVKEMAAVNEKVGEKGTAGGTVKETAAADSCEYEISWLPGISSMAYFCNLIGVSYEDVFSFSIHGRSTPYIRQIAIHEKTFLLTDGKLPELGRKLVSYGMENATVWVGMDLAAPTQYIRKMTPKELADFPSEDCRPLTVCLVLNPDAERWRNPYRRDEEFCRDGKTPMTKEEVRGIILGKLHPESRDVIYDIGGGSGSVSVACAIAASGGAVYSVESDPDAVKLIDENRRRFACDNIEIIFGYAPEALRGLPAPNRVFIGGSGGKLAEILEKLEDISGISGKNGGNMKASDITENIFEKTKAPDTMEDISGETKVSDTVEDISRETKASDTMEDISGETKVSDTVEDISRETKVSDTLEDISTEKKASDAVEDTSKEIRIVISSITLETTAAVSSYINTSSCVKNAEVCQLAVAKSKKAGSSTLMMGQNPVTIFSFDLATPE